jgi:hypothetical protein
MAPIGGSGGEKRPRGRRLSLARRRSTSHAIHADRGRSGQSNFHLIIDLAALSRFFANCLPTALSPSCPPTPPRCDSSRPVCTTCQRWMIPCDYSEERRFRGPGKKTKAQTEKKKKRASEASRAAADQSTAESGSGSMFERRDEEEGMMSGSGGGGGGSYSSVRQPRPGRISRERPGIR